MRVFGVFGILCLLACSGAERKVIVRYDCVDSLPEYVAGRYLLSELVVTDTRTGKVEAIVPRSVSGTLRLGLDYSFEMVTKEGLLVQTLSGYYGVESNLLLIYTSLDSDDILTIFQYSYSRTLVTLESYNGRSKRRFVMYWRKISSLTYGS